MMPDDDDFMATARLWQVYSAMRCEIEALRREVAELRALAERVIGRPVPQVTSAAPWLH